MIPRLGARGGGGGGGGGGAGAAALALLVLLPAVSSGPVGAAVRSTYRPALAGEAAACSVGDAVYQPGDAVPGREACERCVCGAGGALSCRRRTCDARPGCKALHRPDECCPTYQCECEQEGRVYANGEKLVDPVDPCKVCYCQGGEVVCRRIACFLRSDCEPRLVAGRCCPEYDHCPLRGVTTEPSKSTGITTSVGGSTAAKKFENIAQKADESAKKEITIKEVTPVSEIPAFSGIRIKEIPPSPTADVSEYSFTTKSQLAPREKSTESTTGADRQLVHTDPKAEAITENPLTKTEAFVRGGETVTAKVGSSAPANSDEVRSEDSGDFMAETSSSDAQLTNRSTVETASSETPPVVRVEATSGPRPAVATARPATPSEEDDSATFELVNPAFPPLPDDLSELNRDDSDTSDPHEHPTPIDALPSPEPTLPAAAAAAAAAASRSDHDSEAQLATSLPADPSPPEAEVGTRAPEQWPRINDSSADLPLKTSPLLNLRSALPDDILNVPSALPELITGEVDVANENIETATNENFTTDTVFEVVSGTSLPVNSSLPDLSDVTSSPPDAPARPNGGASPSAPSLRASSEITLQGSATEKTHTETESAENKLNTENTISIETSTVVAYSTSAEVGSSTSFASAIPSADSVVTSAAAAPITNPPEVVQVAHASTTPKNVDFSKWSEATPAPGERSEGTTAEPTHSSEQEAVDGEASGAQRSRSGALIAPAASNKNNVLTDLINLVGDVASIGESTRRPQPAATARPSPAIPDSEELLPVRENTAKAAAGGATDGGASDLISRREPTAAPDFTEPKTIEIEDDETDAVTDSPPPYDRVEPTTRRPIIDDVSDSQPSGGGGGGGAPTDNKDIEIITKSYVPTINRRPTKVVMKKNKERAESEAEPSPAAAAEPASGTTPPASY